MKPRIVIVGVGDTGANLVRRLCTNWQVTVVDTDAEALEQEELAPCAIKQLGDGTSTLVLRKAGAEEAQALVAATADDEVNLEVLRLARATFEIESLYAVLTDPEQEEAYREAGAEVVDRHQTCSALLESRIERRKVATDIGLGEGEIVEVEVMPNSSVIGHRLADLSPRRWLVGAVYRNGELIVPHGDTVIIEGDRVVLIGEPEILGAIATHIGTGESEFPLHYGSNVVALDPRHALDALDELNYLFSATAAQNLEVILRPGRSQDAELVRRCQEGGITLETTTAEANTPAVLAAEAALGDVGLLLLRSERLGFGARVGLSRSRTVQLLDRVNSPVLFCRGSFPYRRVLLSLAETCFHHEAAQLAIDVVRKLEGELHLGVVHQPDLVVGSGLREEMDEKRRQVESLAGMYHVEIHVHLMEGNPIDQVLQLSRDFDLLVLPYEQGRRSSMLRPDVNQNLMHRAPCSTLVMPHQNGNKQRFLRPAQSGTLAQARRGNAAPLREKE